MAEVSWDRRSPFPVFYKVKVEEHKEIKEWFFDEYQDYIDGLPLSPSRTDYQKMIKGESVPYKSFWLNYIRPYLKEYCKIFGVEDYDYQFWLAQYDTDVSHYWHTHPSTHFASVYYMELPYGMNSTEFWKKDFPADEGDLVIFPSWWIHRSTQNQYNKRKTVIAGNLNFNRHSFLP